MGSSFTTFPFRLISAATDRGLPRLARDRTSQQLSPVSRIYRTHHRLPRIDGADQPSPVRITASASRLATSWASLRIIASESKSAAARCRAGADHRAAGRQQLAGSEFRRDPRPSVQKYRPARPSRSITTAGICIFAQEPHFPFRPVLAISPEPREIGASAAARHRFCRWRETTSLGSFAVRVGPATNTALCRAATQPCRGETGNPLRTLPPSIAHEGRRAVQRQGDPAGGVRRGRARLPASLPPRQRHRPQCSAGSPRPTGTALCPTPAPLRRRCGRDGHAAGIAGGVVPEVTGRPSYHPSTLLKINLYGYLNRVQSSRRLEREVQRHVEAMWSPNFKTIADFRKDNGPAIRAT